MTNTDFTYCKGEGLNKRGMYIKCSKSLKCRRCVEFCNIAAELAHAKKHLGLSMQDVVSCITYNHGAFLKKGDSNA